MAIVMVALALSSAFGCSDDKPPPSVFDGGVDGPLASDAPDVSTAQCRGTRDCKGDDVVVACRDGRQAEQIDTCAGGETCSAGRCTSLSCKRAEQDPTSLIGCVFHLFQAENVTSDDELATSVVVANAGQNTALVSIERRMAPAEQGQPAGPWMPLAAQISVPRGLAGRFTVTGAQLWGAKKVPDGGIRVTSTSPVTVAVIHGDDRTQDKTTSTGGTLVFPIQTLGQHYRILTYPQVATPAVGVVGGGRGGAARIAIVGTQPGTEVKLQLPPGVVAIAGLATDPLDGSAPVPIRLDEGEVVQILTTEEGADLSRTEITANLPVAVFSGNITTSYGRSAQGAYTPDMAHEQMPPVRAWSRTYLAAQLPPQDSCGSLLNPEGAVASIWRIIAAEDDTSVSFAAPDGVTGLPPFPLTMNRDDLTEMVVWGGSFEVIATKPVLVSQGMDCEPSLSLAVPTESFLEDFSFAILPYFDHVLSVVRPPGAPVSLDGVPLDNKMFKPVGDYEVSQVTMAPCPFSMLVCPHQLTGKFGATLRGMDVLASFALTVTTSKGCADPDSCSEE